MSGTSSFDQQQSSQSQDPSQDQDQDQVQDPTQNQSQSQTQSQDAPASPRHSSPDPDTQEWNASASQPRPAPLQKRRRVTRACDECRRKKIKCDGKQPCTHCTVYSYDCTYDQPSNRRRNPAPQYIEALETRLQRAESLLRTFLPNVDLNDPSIDAAALQQQRQAALFKDAPITPSTTTSPMSIATPQTQPSGQDAQLRSMIESTGQLDLDERGNWDFHGGSSGTVFVQRMREQFGNLLGPGPVLFRSPQPALPGMFDSPRSTADSPFDSGLPNTIDLPQKEVARSLSNDCLQCACCLLRFVHQPTFYRMLDRIYELPPEGFGDEENRFLPLLYMTLALGCLFASDSSNNYTSADPDGKRYKGHMEQGFKYFKAARQMLDVTDCRDITSLQAVLFMIMFLQASANLSTCYSYIGIALRSALRMGLHRSLSGTFNPIERETRKRVFWIVRKMDTYVSAMLGFPMMLSPDDIDQELPSEIDDEYITKDAVLPMPPGKLSMYVASNAHTRLMWILAKVIKHIYPIKGLEESVSGNSPASYTISHAKIRDIERDLADWLDKLPMDLRPGGEGSPELLRIQQLLRLAYAHVQMMLYRPFLHYVSEKSCAGKPIDERSYACAAACVSVSRNIIHITTEMKRRGLLVGAYWFSMYTTFFSIISLVYYVLENPDKNGTSEILADAKDGKVALDGLAQRSMAADRCSMTLKGLFEQLPSCLKTRPASAPSKKKRSAPATNPSGNQSTPDLARPQSSHVSQVARATTFPVLPTTPLQTSVFTMNHPDNRFQINTSSNPNLRQSFQDIVSPTELSSRATPEVGTPGSLHQGHQFGVPNQFDVNNSIPYLSAMMFPSTDPFAYPNQAMIEFDAQKQGAQDSTPSNPRPQNMYVANGSGMYDDLEGQLFGPLPPYLIQGQGNYNIPSPQVGANMMSSFHPQEMVFPHGLSPNSDMTGMFSNDREDWNMSMDQRFRQ
ncbi:Gypsy retrotransposon integrase-like protein 1 [Clarireedia jacksonii]